QDLKDAAAKHHEILSQIDSQYTVESNYYAYMADIMTKVRSSIKLSPEMKGEFDQRIGIAIADFRKQALQETKRLLPQEDPLKAFKISLKLKYGTTPERLEALNLLLPHIDVKKVKGSPRYLVKMATIRTRLQDWVRGLPASQRPEALEAVRYLLDQLFERGEKMEAFWNGQHQKVESFFGSDSFGKSILGGANNLHLQELITWSHGESKKAGSPISPDADPHEHFRKWTFTGELGVAALGLGTAFIPYGDPNADYYGHGASVILGASGLGAAGGNALSYALDIKDHKWLFDAGGAVLGGLVGGLIYGFTTTKPDMMPPGQMPPPEDPGHRNPVDPYGP
ncbi:MAG: hypothetical protein R3257_07475, partial [bacterium]|nr:hypothetical protein [bacterium]